MAIEYCENSRFDKSVNMKKILSKLFSGNNEIVNDLKVYIKHFRWKFKVYLNKI